MTNPYELNERAARREQRFDGTIDEVEYASPTDTDRRLVKQLEVRLAKGDRIIIPAEQSPNPGLSTVALYVEGHDMSNPRWETSVKASVSIGGTSGYKPDNLNFVSLSDAPVNFLPAYLTQQGAADLDPAWLVIAQEVGDGHNMDTGMAFIPRNMPHTTLGRNGNLKWIKFGVQTDAEDWNPFLDNPSIEELQLMLTVIDEDLAITALAEQSPSIVNTRASREHLQIIT